MKLQILALTAALALPVWAAKTLDIYFIDVEAGSATLVISPAGQSMLIDTGTPNMAKRDLAAIHDAGLKSLDYLLITHFHADHFGAVAAVAKETPVSTFVDHGDCVEAHRSEEWKKAHVLRFSDELYDAYLKAREGSKHLVAVAGETIPFHGAKVTVVTAAGKQIAKPMRGAGATNQYCSTSPLRAEAENEDSQSVGTVFEYGKFRYMFLGDLNWNNGIRLVCPVNKIGPLDVFETTHHAMNVEKEHGGEVISSYSACSKAEVWGLAPRVSILNYGPGFHRSDYFGWFGGPEGWDRVRSAPGLVDAWQLHYQPQGAKEHNVADEFIANLTPQNCEGHWLKLSAMEDGSFTIANSRTGVVKQYKAR